jgi:DNA-binding transcriptional regulator YiaG
MTLIEEVQAWKLPSPRIRRAIRQAAAVTQVRMAAELGVHRVTFARWETGDLEPRGDNRTHYARLLAELQRVAA